MAAYWIAKAARDGMGGLDLTNHRLASLPPGIGEAAPLQKLILDRNRLTTIPPDIGKLKNLYYLSIQDNPLIDIPKELGHISDACAILLDTRYLPKTMTAAYRAGIPNFLAYLRSLSDAEPNFEAKIIFVGDGNAGKTTCLERLATGLFRERNTTHGIEVRQISLPRKIKSQEISLLHDDTSASHEMIFNCWDFGGQDIYRVTHQCYYSQDAIYLLLWNPRDKARRQGLEDWLENIRLRVGVAARVVIIATHADEDRRGYRVDYDGLLNEYSSIIVGFLEIDSKTGLGFDGLINTITDEAARLPHVGDLVNRQWRFLRDDLLQHKPHISFDDFIRVCSRHKVREEEREPFLMWLHAIGRVLFFHDDLYLRNLIITEPEWLTKAMGCLVADRNTLERRGELPHNDLPRIWVCDESLHGRSHLTSYRREHLPYLLRLTERFDITYKIPYKEHLSLVGELVPEAVPENLPWRSRSDPVGGNVLSLVCKLPTVLPGLMPRLIVRTHRFTTGLHWTRGVYLEQNAQRDSAVLELVKPLELHLTVRSEESPTNMFDVLREHIEAVIKYHYKDIDPLFLIPCRTIDAGSFCDGTFMLRNLEKARAKRITKISCQSCFQEMNVDELFTGFKTSENDILQAIRNIEEKIGVAAGQAIIMRDLLRHISEIHEQVDCPRLFRMEAIDVSKWNPKNWLDQKYKLTLYCEHPECEHPCEEASYVIENARAWLKDVKPYIGYVGKAIRYGVPILAAGMGVMLGNALTISERSEIDLAKTFSGLSSKGKKDKEDKDYVPPPTGNERLDGAAFFEFRHMLLRLTADKYPKFGGLRRVRDTMGRYLWVCPRHDEEFYNPPLPTIGQ